MTSENDAAFDDLRARLGVSVTVRSGAVAPAPPVTPSAWLRESLRRGLPKATRSDTARARAAWLVTPVLTEVEDALPPIAVFSGRRIPAADPRHAPDYIIAAARGGKAIAPPILAVVTVALDDGADGLIQCITALRAARALNGDGAPVGGVITDGMRWQLLDLRDEATVVVDPHIAAIDDLAALLGVLHQICTWGSSAA